MSNQDDGVHNKQRHDDQFNAIKSLVSDFLKFSVFVYALGFVIVNFAFWDYGFMVYDISSARFLLAGLLFVTICSLVFCSMYICRKIIRENSDSVDQFFVYLATTYILILCIGYLLGLKYIDPQKAYGPSRVSAILVLIPFMFISMLPILIKSKIKDKWRRILVNGFLVLSGVEFLLLYGTDETKWLTFFIVLLVLFSYAFFRGKDKKKNILFSWNNIGITVFLTNNLISILIMLSLFGSQIYPKIDRMRGGGAPLKIELVLLDNQNEAIIQSFVDDSLNFRSATLLYETGDSIFLAIAKKGQSASSNKVALEIPRRNILGIKYLQNKQYWSQNALF